MHAMSKQELAEGAQWLTAFGEELLVLREVLLSTPETLVALQDAETGRKFAGTSSQVAAALRIIVNDMTRRLKAEPLDAVIANPIAVEGGDDTIALACALTGILHRGQPDEISAFN